MIHKLALIIFFALSLIFNNISYAKSGCCSWHHGVSHCNTSSGRIICNDGTFSPSCMCEPTSKNPKFQPNKKNMYQEKLNENK